jgi:WD40-like Beta Propeller Repeat
VRTEGGRIVDVRVVTRQLGGAERPISRRLERDYFIPRYWTKDGQLLELYGTLRQVALWPTTRPDASEPDRVLASHPNGSLWQPSLSPNERWLSFLFQKAGRTDQIEMFVAPGDGGPPERWVRLAADHAWPDKPRWAPDGRILYFISKRSSRFDLRALQFDPDRGVPVGQPFEVKAFDSPGLHISPHVERAEMDVSARHVS